MENDAREDVAPSGGATGSSTTKRRGLRLSLRALMVIVLVVGGGIGWRANRARTQKRAVEAIKALNGTVLYDFEYSFDHRLDPKPPVKPEPTAPAWLRKLFGDEYFQEVTEVNFRRPLTGPLPSALAQLGHLEWIYLTVSSKEVDLAPLGRLTTLRGVGLSGLGVTDETLEVVSKLPCLQQVNLSKVAVTDAGLDHLSKLPRLSIFSMGRTQAISDVGIGNLLASRPKLETLILDSMGVTDAGTAHLKMIPG